MPDRPLAEGLAAEGTVVEGTVVEGTVAEGTVAEGTALLAGVPAAVSALIMVITP